MKIWLINPRTDGMIHTELPGYVSKEVGRFPPLGLLALAAYVRANSAHTVEVFDLPASGVTYDELATRMRADPPDLVGITGTTHNLVEILQTAETVKAAAPATRVCLGGPHVDAFPVEALALKPMDFTVWGEGERAFLALIEALAAGRDGSGIGGVSIKRAGVAVQASAPAEPVADLDTLPFPARDLVDGRNYYYVLGRRATFATIVSSRGCPFRCIFCSTPHGSYRERSFNNLVDEIEACLVAGAEEIHFVDDTFNVRAGRLAELGREILKRNLKARWSIRARVDTVEEDGLRLARAAGCVRIHYGVETGTDEGLQLLKKGITIAQVERAVMLARRHGIATAAYFIIGCPHERTREDVLQTIRFACRLGPDFAMFNVLAIYPHTELFDMAVKRGLIGADRWRAFARNPTPDFKLQFWDEYFTTDELADLMQTAYRRFYFRPSVIWRNLCALGSWTELRHKSAAAFALLAGRSGNG